jgi:ubiquinone/menaquinone biosynthesis C-methylase UbiE
MDSRKNRVCPVERAGSLDTRLRRWTQNPRRLLRNYLEEGMTVLDMGCGPGFFSVEMARMVGETGRVIAVDLQEGMLRKVRDKIEGTELEERITLHLCEEDKIGVSEPVDFVLMFYVVHEVPDQAILFRETESILKQGGYVFIVEPPFHVSKKGFKKMIKVATETGLSVVKKPKILMNRAVVLGKN